jgi:hypothetical protein
MLLLLVLDLVAASPRPKPLLEYIVPAARARQFYEHELWTDRFFTPSKAEVDRMRPGLARLIDERRSGKNPHGLEKVGRYRRQYVGLLRDGKRLIWIYGFQNFSGERYRVDEPGPSVSDGACSFWRAFYDLATGEFVDFYCNSLL